MIIIHSEIDEDTKRLRKIYEGLDNIVLLKNKPRDEIYKAIKESQNGETIMLLGHGDRYGLWDNLEGTKIITPDDSKYLRGRNIIGIWCYASEFADTYRLSGFFTSMFISNLTEALMLGFSGQSQEDIYSELDIFCENLNSLLSEKIELKEWPGILQEGCHKDIPFVRFNYEALCYYGKD